MKRSDPHFIVRVDVQDVSPDYGLEDSPFDTESVFVTATLSDAVLASIATGRIPSFPITVSDRLPGHERFLDFLIEKGLKAWTSSRA
ncbi:MAG: hypothetical protein KF795_00635 [Labilithrix sp.]|nr:hypothetical protein [Labilithrix sp.]